LGAAERLLPAHYTPDLGLKEESLFVPVALEPRAGRSHLGEHRRSLVRAGAIYRSAGVRLPAQSEIRAARLQGRSAHQVDLEYRVVRHTRIARAHHPHLVRSRRAE